ncbi:MAG: hypothetical protein ABJ301_29250, partial [Rhodopirellula bahusiensis]
MTEKILTRLRLLRRASAQTSAAANLDGSEQPGVFSINPNSECTWKRGDWAIYRKSKRSKVPGPRASSVKPNLKGETYNYVVQKFWMVDEVH